MIGFLNDSSSSAANFQLKALNYSVANLPGRARTLLLQSANGNYAIAVWDESRTLNSSLQLNAPGTTITFQFDDSVKNFSSIAIYNPISETKTTGSLTNQRLSIGLSAQPILILLNR